MREGGVLLFCFPLFLFYVRGCCLICFRRARPIFQVPAFAYSKSHIPEERWGTEYYGMMHVTDWLPTIATAAGIALDGG